MCFIILLRLGIYGYTNCFSIFVSLLIIYALYGILTAIFKKTKISFSILIVFAGIFSILNELKIFYTREPIMFSDIKFLSNMGEISSFIETTIGTTLLHHWFHIFSLIVICAVLIFCSHKYSIELKNKKLSKIIMIISTMTLVTLFVPTKFIKDFMLNNVFEINEREVIYEKNNLLSDYGVIAGMYEQFLESKISEPNGYNEKELNEILKNISLEENNTQNTQKPNIILYFSESFFDISKLTDVKFDKEVTSNFNKLKEKGKFLNVISPVHGGTSANVEYELFAGANTCYFNSTYIPYLQLFTNEYTSKESIIKQLKNNGYKTKILTANGEKLYNCKNAYQNFEIEEMRFLGSEKVTSEKVISEMMKGTYISDEYMVKKVIEDFELKSSNKPIFYIMQTMQTHMPYRLNKYNEYDIKIENSSYNKETNDILLSYAQGLYDADKQLKHLYDYINTLEEPTILIFMGDHVPPFVKKDGGDIIDDLKYFNTENELTDIYRKYNMQALVLANYDIGNFDDTNYLGFDLLLTYVMKNSGLELSEYYDWLYTTKDILPSNNHYISIDANGNLYKINEMPEEMKKIYDLKEKMQYMFFIKQ